MAKPFQLDVVSPEATVWSGEAEFLVARTTEGEIGVLADHEPTMAALATGSAALPGPRPAGLARICALAADTVARALARGVYAADTLGDKPGYRSVHGHALKPPA